jgi:hypothetical protein
MFLSLPIIAIITFVVVQKYKSIKEKERQADVICRVNRLYNEIYLFSSSMTLPMHEKVYLQRFNIFLNDINTYIIDREITFFNSIKKDLSAVHWSKGCICFRQLFSLVKIGREMIIHNEEAFFNSDFKSKLHSDKILFLYDVFISIEQEHN